MASQKVTLAIFFIIFYANAETWQEKFEKLSQKPNHIFSLYDDFSLTEGESPKTELSKLINSVLGVQGSHSADAWFEFQLGDSSAFGTEIQEWFGKTEEELVSDFQNSITQLFNSKINEIENLSQFEKSSEQKKELILSFYHGSEELGKNHYSKFLFHQLNQINQGTLKNLNPSILLTTFTDTIMKQLKEFNSKFNKKSDSRHEYSLVNDQKVFVDQEAFDTDISKFESINELNKIIPELVNQSFKVLQNSDGKYIDKYLNVVRNLENYLRIENSALLEAIKLVSDETKIPEIEDRLSDLVTKQMRYFKTKKGWNTLENQFAYLIQFYSECGKQESNNSEFFNRKSLPVIVSVFINVFESQYEPSSLAKTESLKMIRKFVALRGLPSTTSTSFMKKLNLLNRKSEIGQQKGLRTDIDHLNLVWEFKDNAIYNEELQSEIIQNCVGLLSIDANTLKTMILLNKVFYNFVVPISEATTEFYQTLYEIVLEFVSSRQSSDSVDNLKTDFVNFVQNYVSNHKETRKFYISFLFSASSLMNGHDFELTLLKLSETEAESNAHFIEENQMEIKQNIEYLYFSVLHSKNNLEQLSKIVENLGGQEINTSDFNVFGQRILL